MNRGFVFILILAVGLVVTSCLRQGKQNVTYDFTPLDSIISTWMDKGYYVRLSIDRCTATYV